MSMPACSSYRSCSSERFADARREVEHVAENAAAQRAGHEQPIAGLAAGARERPAFGQLAERGDADHKRAVVRVRVAAGDRDVELLGERQQAFVQRNGQWQRRLGRRRCGGAGRAKSPPPAGSAAIAARSLRFAPSAWRPIRRGSSTSRRKSTPSVEHVGRDDDIRAARERNDGSVVAQAEPRARVRSARARAASR